MAWSTPAAGATLFAAPQATTVATALSGSVQVDDLVVVVADWSASADEGGTATCTDNLSNTYTRFGTAHPYEAANEASTWFYALVANPGTPTVTVTLPGARANRGLAAQAYRSSIPGTPTLDVSLTNGSAGTVSAAGPDNLTGPALVTSADGALAVAFFCNVTNTTAFSAGTGWVGDRTTVAAQILEHKVQASAGTITPTGTSAGSTGHYFAGAAAFLEPTSTADWTIPSAGLTVFTAGSAATITGSLSGAVSVGDVVVVAADWSAGSDEGVAATCTDTLGNQYTNMGSCYQAGNEAAALFVCVVTRAGVPALTVTLPGARTNRQILAQTYRSSLAGTPSVDAFTVSNASAQVLAAGPNNLTGPTLSTLSDGCLVVSLYLNVSGTQAFSAGSGWTSDQNPGAVAGAGVLQHRAQVSAGQVTPTGTSSASTGDYFRAVFALAPTVATAVAPENTVAPTITLKGVEPPPPPPPPPGSYRTDIDVRATRFTSLPYSGYPNSAASVPSLPSFCIYQCGDITLVADARWTQVFRVHTHQNSTRAASSHNPWGMDNPWHQVPNSAELTYQRTLFSNEPVRWYAQSFYLESGHSALPSRSQGWGIFSQLGYPSIISPPIGFAVETDGVGIDRDGGASDGASGGTVKVRQNYIPLSSIYNKWLDIVCGVLWRQDYTGWVVWEARIQGNAWPAAPQYSATNTPTAQYQRGTSMWSSQGIAEKQGSYIGWFSGDAYVGFDVVWKLRGLSIHPTQADARASLA